MLKWRRRAQAPQTVFLLLPLLFPMPSGRMAAQEGSVTAKEWRSAVRAWPAAAREGHFAAREEPVAAPETAPSQIPAPVPSRAQEAAPSQNPAPVPSWAQETAPSQNQETALSQALEVDEVQAGLRHIDDRRTETAELLRMIGGIVSPSGEEHDRAAAVARRMREMGLSQVRVTSSPNAIGVIPGESERVLVFVSTLDDLATVAEHQRAAGTGPVIEGDRVIGPGTNTSLTTAALLAAAHAYLESGLKPHLTLVFAAVAQEETGLVGMRDLYREFGDRARGLVDVLGDGHSISYGAIGIHWWRIIASGPGGHTLSGGLPNVNQGIGRAVDRILSLPDAARQDDTRTRVNISVLESGRVFNHKPESGWFSLDIRAMDAGVIEAIETRVGEILTEVSAETGIDFEMDPFQLTPGGQIPGAESSSLLNAASAISRYLGYEPSLSDSGSSNMNVAVAGGTLAIGLGGSRGGERGQTGEWADIDGMMRTAKQIYLLSVLEGGRTLP
ncbi:MAG: M20/M25/M40 family metallo-hydrolase [Longimicrobiales bacterium]